MSDEVAETEVSALDDEPDEIQDEKPDVKESEPAEEPDETPEVEEEEKLPAGKAEEEEEEEKEETPKAIRFSEIKKEFPELFKKYPDLRANYFQAEKFKEYFPTIEDAEEAARKTEIFDVFNEQVTQGDVKQLFDAIGQTNPKGLEKVADEVLPKLYAIDSRLYSRATAPVIKQLLQFAGREAVRTNNENLKNSVGHLAQFVYGSSAIPQDQKPAQQNDPEKIQLQQQNQTLIYNQASGYEQTVKMESSDDLKKEVITGLDTDNKFNQWQLDKLTDDIMNDVNQILLKDQKHQREMASLWNHAFQNGFPVDMKAKLRNAHLARAKMIIPAIRQRRKSEALGTSTPENKQKRTLVPQNSGPARKSGPKIPTAKEARKEGLSELDVLNRV